MSRQINWFPYRSSFCGIDPNGWRACSGSSEATDLLWISKLSMIRSHERRGIEEIKDELRVYKDQLDALREDLKIVVKYSPSLRNLSLFQTTS
jgi:hypothetical protein